MPEGTKQDGRDIWIIGGDFNTTPDSAEIATILRSGFIDTIPDKCLEDADQSNAFHNQVGSKWSLSNNKNPPIVLDYIFCGLEQFTFPASGLDVSKSKRPFRPHFDAPAFATDHAVLFAEIKL